MENIIVLKWGNIRDFNLPITSESYKAINELMEREEKCRE